MLSGSMTRTKSKSSEQKAVINFKGSKLTGLVASKQGQTSGRQSLDVLGVLQSIRPRNWQGLPLEWCAAWLHFLEGLRSGHVGVQKLGTAWVRLFWRVPPFLVLLKGKPKWETRLSVIPIPQNWDTLEGAT